MLRTRWLACAWLPREGHRQARLHTRQRVSVRPSEVGMIVGEETKAGQSRDQPVAKLRSTPSSTDP